MTTAEDLPGGLTDWWDDFARSLRRRGRSPKTIGLYRRAYDRFWRWALSEGVDDPSRVTTRLINGWVDHLQVEVGQQTVSIYWRNARPFFAWWAKEVDAVNPFIGADVPASEVNPPPVIHIEDIRKLLDVCGSRSFEDRRDNAIIRVLFDTGIRLGELTGLATVDWDRRQDFLTVSGKTGMRAVSVSASTGEALSRYMRARGDHPLAGLPAMWLGRKGALGDSGIAQLLTRRCSEAGLPRINPHRFRHTFSHEFRAQGGSDVDLMYLAGWTSTAMAARYGASAAAERARSTHRRLGLGDRL